MNNKSLSALVDQVRGVSYKPKDIHDTLNDLSIVLLRANNIFDGSVDFSDVIYIDRKRVSPSQILRRGDILVCASSGSKDLVGKAASFNCDGEYTFGAFCKVVRPKNVDDADYISMFFQSPKYRREIAASALGANINNIRNEHIDNLIINWPVKLNRDIIVSLLNQSKSIITLRKKQLQLFDELIKARFVEMFGDPISNPKKWKVVKIGDIVKDVRYGTSRPAVEGGKYPYLRMNNLTVDGQIDLTDLKYIDIPESEIEKCIVRKGDVLFNRTNSVELVGKTALFNLPDEMVIAGYIIRLRLNKDLRPEILSQYLNLKPLKDILRSMAKGAVNQANINAKELQNIRVYLPEMELQNAFVVFAHQIDKSKVMKRLRLAHFLFVDR